MSTGLVFLSSRQMQLYRCDSATGCELLAVLPLDVDSPLVEQQLKQCLSSQVLKHWIVLCDLPGGNLTELKVPTMTARQLKLFRQARLDELRCDSDDLAQSGSGVALLTHLPLSDPDNGGDGSGDPGSQAVPGGFPWPLRQWQMGAQPLVARILEGYRRCGHQVQALIPAVLVSEILWRSHAESAGNLVVVSPIDNLTWRICYYRYAQLQFTHVIVSETVSMRNAQIVSVFAHIQEACSIDAGDSVEVLIVPSTTGSQEREQISTALQEKFSSIHWADSTRRAAPQLASATRDQVSLQQKLVLLVSELDASCVRSRHWSAFLNPLGAVRSRIRLKSLPALEFPRRSLLLWYRSLNVLPVNQAGAVEAGVQDFLFRRHVVAVGIVSIGLLGLVLSMLSATVRDHVSVKKNLSSVRLDYQTLKQQQSQDLEFGEAARRMLVAQHLQPQLHQHASLLRMLGEHLFQHTQIQLTRLSWETSSLTGLQVSVEGAINTQTSSGSELYADFIETLRQDPRVGTLVELTQPLELAYQQGYSMEPGLNSIQPFSLTLDFQS